MPGNTSGNLSRTDPDGLNLDEELLPVVSTACAIAPACRGAEVNAIAKPNASGPSCPTHMVDRVAPQPPWTVTERPRNLPNGCRGRFAF